MKLFFAAPLSGLPSDPIALGAQVSRLHFARKAVRAAPASSRPSFPIALLSHVPGACADAEPIANAVNKTASMSRVMSALPSFSALAVVASVGMRRQALLSRLQLGNASIKGAALDRIVVVPRPRLADWPARVARLLIHNPRTWIGVAPLSDQRLSALRHQASLYHRQRATDHTMGA